MLLGRGARSVSTLSRWASALAHRAASWEGVCLPSGGEVASVVVGPLAFVWLAQVFLPPV